MDWIPFASLGLVAAAQLGAIAYWGGRISSRLDGLAQRLERLEQIELRRAA